MLIILVGPTLDVAENSRLYFEERGYSVIQKYNYSPDDENIYHYGKYTNCAEEVVDKCDFVYKVHNGKTGFYKAQILDAVHGKCNALITMSPDNLEFIRQIKASYGEYVLLVYLYIDKHSLEAITRTFVKDEDQIEMRLQKGAELRKMFLSNATMFDKTVIFSVDTEFNFDALYKQYDIIMKEAEDIQRKGNKTHIEELPYKGNDAYVFVSYSHMDKEKVLSYLTALQRKGFRIWYDQGIYKGSNWCIFLGERIKNCTNFLLFGSENSVKSANVHSEINGIMSREEIYPLTVFLDESEFPMGYDMYLSKYQYIYEKDGDAVNEIAEALDPATKVK